MRITPLHTVPALLLLFAIVVIVIAPSVDLDPTTLRASQAAILAMAAVAAAGMVLADVLVPDWTAIRRSSGGTLVLALSGLLDLICTRLCWCVSSASVLKLRSREVLS